MDPKYAEFTGVDSLYYAKITKDDATGYITGTPIYLAPTAEIAGDAKTGTETKYYDNKPQANYLSEGPTELKTVVANIPAYLMADILGKDYDASTGRVNDDGQPDPPYLALGYRLRVGRNDYRYYWFLKGTFAGGAETASTSSDKVETKNYELAFTAINTTYEFTANSKTESKKRVFGDTTDAAFSATGWFLQVQTPLTTVVPAVPTVTALPANSATAVVVTIKPTLTFNNAIATQAVTLVKSTDYSITPATYAFDAANKVLTITPSTNLTAATTYLININGVKDVYGQILAPSVIKFTTA